MKKLIALIALATLSLTACNTWQGVKTDAKEAGNATVHGLEKAGQATGRGLEKAGQKLQSVSE